MDGKLIILELTQISTSPPTIGGECLPRRFRLSPVTREDFLRTRDLHFSDLPFLENRSILSYNASQTYLKFQDWPI
jgi:hypothetical protein